MANLDYSFYVYFCSIIRGNHFWYFFIILIHLKSYFLCIISSFVPYANVSVESIILLSSAAFNTILISASVNTCLLVLNVCCDFKISLLFFMNSLWFSQRLSTSTYFFLVVLFYFQVGLLLNNVYNLQIKSFVMWHTFSSFCFFYFHHYHLLNSYTFLVSIRQTLSLLFHLIHLSLILINLLSVMVCLIHTLKHQI